MAIASNQAPQSTAPVSYRIGSRGNEVAVYQERLNQLGYNVGKADGVYGKMTASQVMKFQQANGLTADGILGANTINAMINAKTAGEKVQSGVAPTTASGIKSADMMNQETQPIAPPAPLAPAAPIQAPAVQAPTGQQLGAQAQTFDPFSMYTPNVAPPAPNMAGFKQADARQMQQGTVNTGYAPLDDALNQSNQEQQALRDGASASASVEPAIQTPVSADGLPSVTTTYTGQAGQNNPIQTGGSDLGYSSEFTYQPTPVAPPRTTTTTAPNGGGTTGTGLSIVASPSATVGATAGGNGSTTVSPELELSIATGNSLVKQADELYTELETMSPEWNPEEDKEYQRDAVILENKVAQMMVSRGGLYSSVARAGLSSAMIDLELGYRKQSYERFITERDFVFKQLQFVSSRIDAEFEKGMALKNYELAVQKEQFNQKMAIAQFKADQAARAASLSIQRAQLKASQDRASAEQQLADAARSQQNTYNALKQDEAAWRVGTSLFSSSVERFAGDGYLTTEQKAFLGIDGSAGYWDTVNAINAKRRELETTELGLKSRAMQFGDAQTTLDMYSGSFTKDTSPSEMSETMDIFDADGKKIGSRTVKR